MAKLYILPPGNSSKSKKRINWKSIAFYLAMVIILEHAFVLYYLGSS
jgi:hypothetical protein